MSDDFPGYVVDPAIITGEPDPKVAAEKLRLTLRIIPACECPDLDITTVADLRNGIHRFIKGWASYCPVHGYEGTEPTYRKVMGFEDRS